MPKETLLEKALKNTRNQHRNNKFSEEEVELAIAWANGEVGILQVAEAINLKGSGGVYVFLARALRQTIQNK